jgi:2-polyprenyl-3-methyl-5-hydroxy-6-metoxy-1,4-benzoquinol methylase
MSDSLHREQPDAAAASEATAEMRMVEQPDCPICDSTGEPTYSGMSDSLYHAPGRWSMSRCVNPECGAFWLTQTPHPDDLWIAYRNYYTHRSQSGGPPSFRSRVKHSLVRRRFGYPEKRRPWNFFGDTLFRGLFPGSIESAYYEHLYLPWHPGGRLLEIGCGAGDQLLTLKKAGWTVFGVDFDPDAVDTAKSRGLTVSLGDVRDMDFADQSFDAIVMGHVIEHVYDPVDLLRECRRLICPGGLIVVVTPNAVSIGHQTFKESWRGLEPPRHMVVFTPKALRLAFRLAGIDPERTRFSARDAVTMLQISAGIQRGRRGGRHRKISQAIGNWHLRQVASLERLGAWVHRSWAEEQILVGRRPIESAQEFGI